MEVVAQGVVDPRVSDIREIAETKTDGGITFVLFHVGYVKEGCLEQGNPVGYSFLKHRADNLFNYIIASKEHDIYSRFRAAFNKLDDELETMVEAAGWEVIPVSERALWATDYNSVVIAINHDKNEVHIAGATMCTVSLARDGKEYRLSEFGAFNLTSVEHLRGLAKEGRHKLRDKDIRFLKSAKLKSRDDYLVVASCHLWNYIHGSIAPFLRVLESRVQAVGLEEACLSMVGLYPDQPKTIVVVPLNRRRSDGHESKRLRLCDVESDNDSEVCDDDDDNEVVEEQQDGEDDLLSSSGDFPDNEEGEVDDGKLPGAATSDEDGFRRWWDELESDDFDTSYDESMLKPWDGNERPLDAKTSIWYSLLCPCEPYPGISRDPSHWGQKRTQIEEEEGGLPKWIVGSMWERIAKDMGWVVQKNKADGT